MSRLIAGRGERHVQRLNTYGCQQQQLQSGTVMQVRACCHHVICKYSSRPCGCQETCLTLLMVIDSPHLSLSFLQKLFRCACQEWTPAEQRHSNVTSHLSGCELGTYRNMPAVLVNDAQSHESGGIYRSIKALISPRTAGKRDVCSSLISAIHFRMPGSKCSKEASTTS